MNGKYVWETANRVRNYIHTYEDVIKPVSFGECREVTRKVMTVIKEALPAERKRRKPRERKAMELQKERSQNAHCRYKTGEMRSDEAMKRLEEIFGK